MLRVTSSGCLLQTWVHERVLRRNRTPKSRTCLRINAVSAPGFNKKSSSVVVMRTQWQKTSHLTASTDAVEQYTSNAVEYLKHLYLPLGAKLDAVDTSSQPAKFTLQLPELRFMNISIRPIADVHVVTGPGKIDITTQGASVEVPDKIKGLGLQDRYSVDATVSVRSTSDMKLHSSAALLLQVDIPAMFKMTPKAMIQVTGTAVIANIVAVLMEDFVKAMLTDIEELSSGPSAPIDLLKQQ